MKTVYAITSGSYSDYTVHAVFERKEDAERFVSSSDETVRPYDSYDIEEMPFYGEGVQPQKITWFQGRMSVNDSEPHIDIWSRWDFDDDRYGMPEHRTRPNLRFDAYIGAPGFYGSGYDREHLAKALTEKVMQYKANTDQLCRDVMGALEKLSGEHCVPVPLAALANYLGRDVQGIAWAIEQLKKAGDVAEPEPYQRPRSSEPIDPGTLRFPVKIGVRPPDPGDFEGTGSE